LSESFECGKVYCRYDHRKMRGQWLVLLAVGYGRFGKWVELLLVVELVVCTMSRVESLSFGGIWYRL